MGALWWVTAEDADLHIEAWRTELDRLQALNMNMMILNGPLVGEDLPPDAADRIKPLFEEAERRGMSLFIDTLAAPDWWTIEDPTQEIARARGRIEMIEDRYGQYASFAGWYVPYEVYVMWGDRATLVRTLYREVAAWCKRVTPAKPVMISPFFILDRQGYLGDFGWATPEEYEAFWTETLSQAEVDIVALQDSGEHLACYTLEDRRPFFEAMKRACDTTDTELWANVETGELNVISLQDYVARFGWKTHVNDAKTAVFWRGVPADKLVQKLRFVRPYTSKAVTWGYREYVRPAHGPIATALYADYRAVLGK